MIIKSKKVALMREAAKGGILRDIEFIKPGMTTHAIDNFVEEGNTSLQDEANL